MILPRLTILGLAGILKLHGAPGSKSGFHRTRLDRSSNPVQSSPKRPLVTTAATDEEATNTGNEAVAQRPLEREMGEGSRGEEDTYLADAMGDK